MRSAMFVLLAVIFLCAAPQVSANSTAGAILINGTCEFGNCASPDILGIGGNISGCSNFTYTFANTDRYDVSACMSAANNAANFIYLDGALFNSYLGNSSNTVSNTDVLTVDVLQKFTGNSGLENFWDFVEGGFNGPLATGSSVEVEAFVDGHPLSVLGPFYPPGKISIPGDFFNIPLLGDPLLIDLRYTATFAAGSGVGSSLPPYFGVGVIVPTSVPEPGSLSLLCSGLLGATCAMGLRREHTAKQ